MPFPLPGPRAHLGSLLSAGLLLLPCAAHGSEMDPGLFSLGLEELMQIEVTSVSRRSQSLAETAAAAYVLTSEDIANSSALNLPDLLRTVPGMEVAQIDANKWAVSARGFNSRLAGKLLVFIDGRHSYVPAYATVFWENEDLILDNIERIEIIRGPGASIWGANALNGVVNITTKSARDTQGSSFSLTAGNIDELIATVGHAGVLGERTFYRLAAKVKEHAGFELRSGSPAGDDWKDERFEFRLDSELSARSTLTFKLDGYDQAVNQIYTQLITFDDIRYFVEDTRKQQGFDASARIDQRFQSGAVLSTQLSYGMNRHHDALLENEAKVYDLDLVWYNGEASRHDLTLGAGVRIIEHETQPSPYFEFSPRDETLKFYNLSFYDNYAFNDDLLLGLGLKLEHNIYTGTEYQANLNFNYALSDVHNVWTAISRAARVPSRLERDGMIIAGVLPAGEVPGVPLDVYMRFTALEKRLEAEYLHGLEAGWRYNPAANISLDVAAFFNDYSDLRNVDPGIPYCLPDPSCQPQPLLMVQPFGFANIDSAQTHGIETVLNYRASPSVNLEFGFSLIDISYDNNSRLDLSGVNGVTPARDDPFFKLNAELDWLLSPRSRINLLFRFVSKPGIGDIDAYGVADLHYVWNPVGNFELTLGARNLGEPAHQEFTEVFVLNPPTLIEHSAYLKLKWRW